MCRKGLYASSFKNPTMRTTFGKPISSSLFSPPPPVAPSPSGYDPYIHARSKKLVTSLNPILHSPMRYAPFKLRSSPKHQDKKKSVVLHLF